MQASRETIFEIDEDILKSYFSSGASVSISEEKQYMIDLARESYGLLLKHPVKHLCLNKLVAIHPGLTDITARRYVEFAMSFFNATEYVDRSFLENWTIARLIKEISSPDASESVRSKNLATLLRHIEAMPEKPTDPKLIESNTIYIRFPNESKLTESQIDQCPPSVRQLLIDNMNIEIDEKKAEKIMKE